MVTALLLIVHPNGLAESFYSRGPSNWHKKLTQNRIKSKCQPYSHKTSGIKPERKASRFRFWQERLDLTTKTWCMQKIKLQTPLKFHQSFPASVCGGGGVILWNLIVQRNTPIIEVQNWFHQPQWEKKSVFYRYKFVIIRILYDCNHAARAFWYQLYSISTMPGTAI